MALRSVVTARQARLGAELKKLRESAGIPGREAARIAGMDQAKLSHLEAGRVAAGAERVRKLAAYYGATDRTLVEALAAMASERGRGWWEKYRGELAPALLDLAELEHHACAIRVFQMVHVPGLFQTEDYARAVHVNAPNGLFAERLEARVEFRLMRGQVLDCVHPPQVRAVVHEAALRLKVGDRRVAHAQLGQLLEASHRPALSLRVIPFERDGFAGAGFPMCYAEGPVRELDTAQFDTVSGSVFVDATERLAEYRNVFMMVEDVALPTAESRDLINDIKREL